MTGRQQNDENGDQYSAARIELTQAGTVVIKADESSWERALTYLPRALDVYCTGQSVQLQPGLQSTLSKCDGDDDRMQIIVEEPSRKLRKFASALAGEPLIVLNDAGQMILTGVPGRTYSNTSSAGTWLWVTTCLLVVSSVVALASLVLMSDKAELRVPLWGSVDVSEIRSGSANAPEPEPDESSSPESSSQSDEQEQAVSDTSAGSMESTDDGLSEAEASALVDGASGGRAQMASMFRDDDAGLTGVVLEGKTEDAQSTVAWIIPGPPAKLVIGSVFSESGENYTNTAAEQAGVSLTATPAASSSTRSGGADTSRYEDSIGDKPLVSGQAPSAEEAAKAEKAQSEASAQRQGQAREQKSKSLPPTTVYQYLDESEAIAHISTTDGSNPVYVFFDPNCIYCHTLWETIQDASEAISANAVDVRWVPVAVMSDTSMGRSAALLDGGLSALQENERNFDTTTEQGGVAPLENAPEHLVAQIKVNTALLYSDGEQAATPTIVWRDGDRAKISVGAPTQDRFEQIVQQAGQ